MKKFCLSIFFFILYLFTYSQWQNLGLGFNRGGYVLYYDTTINVLYVGGDFEYADNILVNGFAKWDGIAWDSMGHGADYGAPGYSITKYQGNIYASSAFSYTNTPPDYSNWFALWNGQFWDTLNQKVNGPIYAFKEYNNELFIGGGFSKIGSQNANLLAKFDGVNFTPINVPSEAGGYRVKTIEFFQGQMYIGGNFYDTITGVNDLERWDGTSFQPFGGNGLGFGSAVVSDMLVFQNNLYIGGDFLTVSGSPVYNIMRWDGNQFHTLSGGLNGGVLKMQIFNNELYVCGGFTMAGSVPANYLAKWNGSQWSTVVPGVFNNKVLDFYKNGNDLYVTGGFTKIDTITVNCIAKYSGLLNVPTNPGAVNIDIYPNPANNQLQIKSDKLIIGKIKITNIFGSDVYLEENINLDRSIDISSLSSGLYFLILETKEGRLVKKFIKE